MSTTTIKVSVVVPVYNVENYLDRCVQSLIRQTYKNIEIVLVNDGSTDSSGAKCDMYKHMYNNILTLHKQNGGLSSARNYAIPYLHGEYVAFVDSDDYVDIDYIECMIGVLSLATPDEHVDMVICSHVNELENSYKQSSAPGKERCISYQQISAETALEIMCYECKFGTSAWGKLIAVELVKQFHFPEGRLYEDLATMFLMLGASNNIIFVNVPMYHYVQRFGSIRNSAWNPKVIDLLWASQNLLDYIDCYYPAIHKAGVYRFFFSANEFYIRAFKENEYMSIIHPLHSKLVLLYPNIKNNNSISIKQRIRYWMLVYAPRIYRLVWCAYKKLSCVLY